jgi:hypothetical protein
VEGEREHLLEAGGTYADPAVRIQLIGVLVAGPVLRTEQAEVADVKTSGEGRTRTGDTPVFSRVLYQLSYLAAAGRRSV